ncbi:hypothetical protein PISMIDRAFT_676035 [Pisolithus microcarpus 441]|uniref:Protochlorophyllide reductase n=1 Tax=Pisolithus microcarpus 441 TaxID=765257 RepID=A0A0D0A2F4_9AGAM|nr:hypothetical protein PISMIDRAFT_676035 [Pisolithus microcarpus 441]
MGIFSSKAFNPERDTPDLTGKVALVTGGNAGIGYATVEHLARKGAKVYMASRNKEKAEAAIAKLKALGLEHVVWLELDLSDPRNAKTAAQEFTNKENRLDILIHNAAACVNSFITLVSTDEYISAYSKRMRSCLTVYKGLWLSSSCRRLLRT